MKRPKVIHKHYTKQAWEKIEEKALKALINLPKGMKTSKSILYGLSKIPSNLFWDKVSETIKSHEKETRQANP